MWDERVLDPVTGRLRQEHRPSPGGHSSEPQRQHALQQQQQRMPGGRASHGGLGWRRGFGSLVLRPQGPKTLDRHTCKRTQRERK